MKTDNCFDLAKANSLGLNDFFFLNKGLKADCSNLLLNASYCVQAVGDIKTYSGYGASVTTRAPAWSTNSVLNCGAYYTVDSGDTCGKDIQSSFSISPSQFSSLNHGKSPPRSLIGLAGISDPHITVDCTEIKAGVAYCVATKTASPTPTITETPAWSTNTVNNCSAYYTVRAGDTCGDDIQPKFGISPSQFSSINKGMTSSSDSRFELYFRANGKCTVDCASIQGGVAYCVATKALE